MPTPHHHTPFKGSDPAAANAATNAAARAARRHRLLLRRKSGPREAALPLLLLAGRWGAGGKRDSD